MEMSKITVKTHKIAKKLAIGETVSSEEINGCNKWLMIECLKDIKKNCSVVMKQLEKEVANNG